MASNRDGRSNRESSRPRAPRHGYRRQRDNHDDNSIDSGYGGSSATASSPNLAQGRFGRDKRVAVDTNEVHSHDSDSDIDSDSDYDPKAKYYLKVDDDAYRDISFQGAGDAETDDPDQSSRARSKRRERKDDPPMKASRSRDRDRHRHPSSRTRTDSRASGDGDGKPSRRRDSRHPHAKSRRASDTSRPRRDSLHRGLSPIPSETSEDWETSPERPPPSRPRSRSRAPIGWRSRAATTGDNTAEQTDDSDYERAVQRRQSLPSPAETRRRADSMPNKNDHSASPQRDDKSNSGRPARQGRSASSQYEGAADMDDAWYKTFKERITRGVDLKQVKKVGLEAAAVAAVKVAVGTQVPWKQRIPKTIAVGLAAAVTDFLVSKTSFQPKGMVGTMYARQFVEIALANLIINPVSSKVTTAAEAKMKGGGKDKGGGQSGGGAGAGARAGSGRGRR